MLEEVLGEVLGEVVGEVLVPVNTSIMSSVDLPCVRREEVFPRTALQDPVLAILDYSTAANLSADLSNLRKYRIIYFTR